MIYLKHINKYLFKCKMDFWQICIFLNSNPMGMELDFIFQPHNFFKSKPELVCEKGDEDR